MLNHITEVDIVLENCDVITVSQIVNISYNKLRTIFTVDGAGKPYSYKTVDDAVMTFDLVDAKQTTHIETGFSVLERLMSSDAAQLDLHYSNGLHTNFMLPWPSEDEFQNLAQHVTYDPDTQLVTIVFKDLSKKED